MKVLYLHQYFNTKYEPGPTRAYFNCLELVKRGCEVTVISASSDKNKINKEHIVDKIKIIYLPVAYSNKMGVKRRFYAFLKFMLLSTKESMKHHFDYVYVSSTPLSVVFPVLLQKKFRRTPYVFEVRDLWPEVPIQMNAITNKSLISFFRWFEKKAYEKSSHIITFSPGMVQGILEAGIDKRKVSLIPSMAKLDLFGRDMVNKEIGARYGIDQDNFNVVYFGSFGRANAIDYILKAAKILEKSTGIRFLFLGNGFYKEKIVNSIENGNSKNVRYLGNFTVEETAKIVNLCQVSLVTFNNIPILSTNSPNKLFDSLSAGIPIIVNSPGWTKALVEDNNCGLYAEAGNPEAMADKILFLKSNRDIRVEMGRNARILAETKYDKSILYKKFHTILDEFELEENLMYSQ